jgi:N-acetylmuramoyl-L-alanine amidase
MCAATVAALQSFQQAYGLPASDSCDESTWAALVEACWKLGDRRLLLTSPNLRGEDVSDLQTTLARLGFDCGKVDGIFGPLAHRALADFQANCGLVIDGVCGPATVRALRLVSNYTGSGPGVAHLRERESSRSSNDSLVGARVVVGQFGGLSSLTRLVSHELRRRGASVMSLDEPDALAQATAANNFLAAAYLGFVTDDEPGVGISYYRVPTFESASGRALAETLGAEYVARGVGSRCSGLRLPILRETRMPAVLVSINPSRELLDLSADLAEAAVQSLELWISRAS